MPQSPHLAGILAARDLDALLEALQDLGPLGPDDEQAVRAVLADWRDEQAISNVLMHACRLIPPDIRIPSIIRGLDERKQPYFILAALVGVQDVPRDAFGDADRQAVRDRMLHIIRCDASLLAGRASGALSTVATREDGPAICNLLDHSSELVRHNLLAWLLRTFDPRTSHALNELLDASTLGGEAKDRERGRIEEHVETSRRGNFSTLSCTMYSYLPNLSDCS